MSVIFEVVQLKEGGYVAGCFEHHIFAEATTLGTLHKKIHRALKKSFGAATPAGNAVQLLFFKD